MHRGFSPWDLDPEMWYDVNKQGDLEFDLTPVRLGTKDLTGKYGQYNGAVTGQTNESNGYTRCWRFNGAQKNFRFQPVGLLDQTLRGNYTMFYRVKIDAITAPAIALYGVLINNPPNRLSYRIGIEPGGFLSVFGTNLSAAGFYKIQYNFVIGEFYNITVVREDPDVRVYINGLEIHGEWTNQPNFNSACNNVTDGISPHGILQNHSVPYNGFVGDFEVYLCYRKALSRHEINLVNTYYNQDKNVDSANGLVAHFDATISSSVIAANGLPLVDGTRISVWEDQSTNGNNAERSISANQPKYMSTGFGSKNLPYIKWDNYLTNTAPQSFSLSTTLSKLANHTVITVFETESYDEQCLIGEADASATPASMGIAQILASNKRFRTEYGDGNLFCRVDSETGFFSKDTPTIFASAYSNGDLGDDLYNSLQGPVKTISGTATSIGGTPRTLKIGQLGQSFAATSFFEGKIGEIKIWNRKLSDSELFREIYFLKAKWGIEATLPGPILHLDALEITSINTGTPSVDDPVDEWHDISGYGNNAVQATLGRQPIYKADGFGANNLPHLLFDGVDDFMLAGSSVSMKKNQTVISVWETPVLNGDQVVVGDLSGVNRSILHRIFQSKFYNQYGSSLGTVNTNGNILITVVKPYIFAYTHLDGQVGSSLYIDGVFEPSSINGSSGNSGGGVASDLGIGCWGNLLNYTFEGKIAEIIIWDRVLGAQELDAELTALKAKWGI